jgi:hypothetical protein
MTKSSNVQVVEKVAQLIKQQKELEKQILKVAGHGQNR